MKTQIRTKKQNGMLVVTTPYNSEFVKKAKDLGGKWNTNTSTWVFNESVEDYIKQALLHIFGVTGEVEYETCSIIIKNVNMEQLNGSIDLFGRTIARASGRDTGVKLGEGIVWISGKKESGGSTKYWKTIVENATFEIQDFPIGRTRFEDVQQAIAEGWVEIKGYAAQKRSKEQILAEISALEEKIANLKAELNNL